MGSDFTVILMIYHFEAFFGTLETRKVLNEEVVEINVYKAPAYSWSLNSCISILLYELYCMI